MGWETSDRRQFLPPNWEDLRQQVFERDGWRCRWKLPSGARCPRRATDVDHTGDRDDHRLIKLRALCSHHHGKLSSQQGVQAREKRKAPRKRKRVDRHPGRF